tara:strand:- start:1380 stop:2273 length:894 start_codon:yes stop_codon:yes gene_type:complete
MMMTWADSTGNLPNEPNAFIFRVTSAFCPLLKTLPFFAKMAPTSSFRDKWLLLLYRLSATTTTTMDAEAARDLLECAKARQSLALVAPSRVAEPFVLDEPAWGFSPSVLKSHVASTSFVDALRASIDLLFINNINNNKKKRADLRRLSTWEPILTHFAFLVNADLAGVLEVHQGRVEYRLPLFYCQRHRGGSSSSHKRREGSGSYCLDLFIQEHHLENCGLPASVRWDLVCAVRHPPPSPLSSVLYASTWTDSAIVDACVARQDESSPLVAFVALAHLFLSAGVPNGTVGAAAAAGE